MKNTVNENNEENREQEKKDKGKILAMRVMKNIESMNKENTEHTQWTKDDNEKINNNEEYDAHSFLAVHLALSPKMENTRAYSFFFFGGV